MNMGDVGRFKAIVFFFKRLLIDWMDTPFHYVKMKLKFNGIVRFNKTVMIASESKFEGSNSLRNNTKFFGVMGFGSYMMQDCSFVGTIGRFTSIGAGFMNVQGVHPLSEPFATTSPMFYSLNKQTSTTFAKKQMFDEMRAPIRIGNDCWIGCRVFANGGLTIGDGAVVLSGAVLTKDVPPYAIVGGVPAKILKYRYDQETIGFLLETKWWEKPITFLEENWEALCDIEKLKVLLTN